MIISMLDEPVSKYTNHKMVVVEGHCKVTDAAKTMEESKTDSVLVFEDNDVTGILTHKDIISEIVAKGKDPNSVKINEIAQKKFITIHKDAKVREAIELMKKHDIRRLVVTNDERTIGIISRKVMIGNMSETAADLPELEIPDEITCPYCGSQFDDKNTLSKHMDDIHIGKGLLEGDLSKA